MDNNYQNMNKQDVGVCGYIMYFLCSCGCLAASIAYVVYLGIYAYSNPDSESAYLVEGLQGCIGTRAEATEAQLALITSGATTVGMYNTHDVFTKWFAWGFWTTLAPCLSIPLFVIFGCMGQMILTMGLGTIMGVGVTLSWVIWVIMGLVWRFGEISACTRDAIQPIGVGQT